MRRRCTRCGDWYEGDRCPWCRMRVSRCRSCQAPIEWALTAAGRRMPIDPAPALTGTIRVADGRALVLKGDDLDQARANHEPLHTTHFATCPEASAHRRSSSS